MTYADAVARAAKLNWLIAEGSALYIRWTSEGETELADGVRTILTGWSNESIEIQRVWL